MDAYNSGRPEYPLDEVRHQVQSLGAEGDVIDLGAGSGKLTKGTQKVGFHTLYHLFFFKLSLLSVYLLCVLSLLLQ